ncbi:MAG: beta-N-acetylhexosaminidase [Flavipsychrobacter sp.]|nr:beta-N-acetylhexosaminidase [Flavipsychrobacter sp.]
MKNILLALLIALPAPLFAQNDANMGIIPAPVSVKKEKGEFKLTPETIIFVDSPDSKAVRFFADYMKKAGFVGGVTDINQVDKKQRSLKNSIMLSQNFKGDMPAEGYDLQIMPDHITINGRYSGMFYGIQTLIQLIHKTGSSGYATIPCGVIKDHPRFGYRGMHLDVVRHFFDVDFVKRYIDLMAAYKLNTFHWHLTDDQGWRIEIKKYPKLTEIGSMRAQTKIGKVHGVDSDLFDNTAHGGYYTQAQIAEVVAYASDRFITIVPEIEMPGHSMALVASYPELSCDPTKPYKVFENWGVSKDVLCPTDATFKMLNDILFEVMELFPGKYIHIGGDECPKDAWKKSDYCRQLIADQGLRDENGLQSYFIGRIEKFINSQGRSMIGWDEILEGGLAPNATVMSWRGETGGIAAAQLNHDVIMTPGSGGLYFDHTQSKSTQEPLTIGGNAPLWKTYNYDPVPATLTKEQQVHILGVQANMWTEYIATPAKVEYMLLPRMLALSEVAWTPKVNKSFTNFSEGRLPHHLAMLETQGYNYRVPTPIGAKDTTVTGDKFSVDLTPTVEGAKIYYTIDGYTPRETDLQYTTPIKFTIPAGKHIDFQAIEITPAGKRSIVTAIKMQN